MVGLNVNETQRHISCSHGAVSQVFSGGESDVEMETTEPLLRK